MIRLLNSRLFKLGEVKVPGFIIWFEGALGILWYLFWAFDLQSFLKKEILAPKICLLTSAGFLFRFAGGIGELNILFWLGSFILMIAVYEVVKLFWGDGPIPPQIN